MRRHFSTDPITGAVTDFEYNESDDKVILHRTADLGPMIEDNKNLASVSDGWSDSKDMRLAARIPLEIAYIWLEKYGIRLWDRNHEDAVKRLLNSNEWRYLRVGHFII